MRDFLLGLPGCPRKRPINCLIRTGIRRCQCDPTDKVNWKSVDFNGSQGLLLNDNSGVGSAAIWQSGNHLYGLAARSRRTT